MRVSVSPRYGYEVVNDAQRSEDRAPLRLPARRRSSGASATASSTTRPRSPPWRPAPRRSRAARRAELVWLLEHPPLYTAGTSARPQELIEARFPVYIAGRGGQFTYHGPGQRVGYVMLDLKRRAPDVRRFVATIEEWIIRTLAAFDVRGERRDDRVGVWVRRPDKGGRLRGQDRRDRHPRAALGDAARLRAQRRAGPVAFFRHRAVRRRRAALRRHVARRSRPARRRWPRSTGRCGPNSSRCSAPPMPTLRPSPARKTARRGGATPNPSERPSR